MALAETFSDTPFESLERGSRSKARVRDALPKLPMDLERLREVPKQPSRGIGDSAFFESVLRKYEVLLEKTDAAAQLRQERLERAMRIYKRAQTYVVVYSAICSFSVGLAIHFFAIASYFYLVPTVLVVLLVGCIAMVETEGLFKAQRVLRTNMSPRT
jgi:hypothetical protein